MLDFLQTDAKLITAWVGAAALAAINKFAFSIADYEIWKIVAIDALTALSLIVVIGYTITRWRKLLKENQQKKTK